MATVHELSATNIYFIVEEQSFISSDRKTAKKVDFLKFKEKLYIINIEI